MRKGSAQRRLAPFSYQNLTQRRRKKMTREKQFLWGIVVASLLASGIMLSGCASLMAQEYTRIDRNTTIVYPDGTVEWASNLETEAYSRVVGVGSQTRQEVRKKTVWDYVFDDFQINAVTLADGIRAGKYRLGDKVNNTTRHSKYVPGKRYTAESSGNKTTIKEEDDIISGKWVNETVLIDPSKPASYTPVYQSRVVSETVNVTDQDAKKEQAWAKQ
jgi:hypothetical protein